jgi:hypothetical protein
MRSTTALARRFRLDVNTGTEGAPVWVQVGNVYDLELKKKASIQKSLDYDDGGAEGNQKTGYSWALNFGVRRAVNVAGAYDVGQEAIRLKDKELGLANMAQVRWYDRTTGAEGVSGWGCVEWSDDKGKADDLASASITLTGNGPLTDIASPL